MKSKLSVLVPHGPYIDGMRMEAMGIIRNWLGDDYEIEVVIVHDGSVQDGNLLLCSARLLSPSKVHKNCIFVMNGASPTVAWHMTKLYMTMSEFQALPLTFIAAIELKWGGDWNLLSVKQWE